MKLWTDQEFDVYSQNTRLSDNVLAASREVLVLGEVGSVAAEKYGVWAPQISRAIKVLRNNQSKILADVESVSNVRESKKVELVQEARNLFGMDLVVKSAKAGENYVGPAVLESPGYFMIQRTGRIAILHELGKLEKIPALNVRLDISYPSNGDLAKVSEVNPEHSREIER